MVVHCTTLAACGEVSIVFTRDKWSVKFKGIVVEKLNCDLYGGMTFHVDNDISVRPKTGEIKIHNKYVVYQTNLLMLPPQVKSMELKSTIVTPVKTILFPKPKSYWSEQIQTKANPNYEGSSLKLELPVEFQNEKFVGIQPRMENKLDCWPETQICQVINAAICIQNLTDKTIRVSKDVHIINVVPLEVTMLREVTFDHVQHSTLDKEEYRLAL